MHSDITLGRMASRGFHREALLFKTFRRVWSGQWRPRSTGLPSWSTAIFLPFLPHHWSFWCLFSCANELEESAEGLAGSQPRCASRVYAICSLSQLLLSSIQSFMYKEKRASIVHSPTSLLLVFFFLGGGKGSKGNPQRYGKSTRTTRLKSHFFQALMRKKTFSSQTTELITAPLCCRMGPILLNLPFWAPPLFTFRWITRWTITGAPRLFCLVRWSVLARFCSLCVSAVAVTPK